MPIAFFEKGTSTKNSFERISAVWETSGSSDQQRKLLVFKTDRFRSAEKEIRYCYGNQWMYAKKKMENLEFWSEALDCTIRRNDKLSEGIVEIVVCDHHEEEIIEESVRILTVSLI